MQAEPFTQGELDSFELSHSLLWSSKPFVLVEVDGGHAEGAAA